MPWWETYVFGKGMVSGPQNWCWTNPSFISWARRPPWRWATRRASAGVVLHPNKLKLKFYYTNPIWRTNFVLCFKTSLFIIVLTLFTASRVPKLCGMVTIYLPYLKFWGHFVTKLAHAENDCFYEKNLICLWFFWDMAVVLDLCVTAPKIWPILQ